MVSYFTVHGIDRSVLSFGKARRPDFFRLVLMGPFRIKYHRSAILGDRDPSSARNIARNIVTVCRIKNPRYG